jgi:hypothetical protein
MVWRGWQRKCVIFLPKHVQMFAHGSEKHTEVRKKGLGVLPWKINILFRHERKTSFGKMRRKTICGGGERFRNCRLEIKYIEK